MGKEPLFLEIDPGTNYNLLDPGMYVIGCSDRFDRESVLDQMRCSGLAGCFNSSFIGILMPYFMHNINNLMVGVMGNLDLAGMFIPQIEKVEPKLVAARAATGSVVDFIRDVSEVICIERKQTVSNDDLKRSLLLLKAACGRSVSTRGLDDMHLEKEITSNDCSGVVSAINGIAAWTVLCLGGSGSVTGTAETNCITFKWRRPEGAGKPHMPGGENSNTIITMAAVLAVSNGLSLIVEDWTDSSGAVTLVFNK